MEYKSVFGWLKSLFGSKSEESDPTSKKDAVELARRLGVTLEELKSVAYSPVRKYRWHRIPKRTGGTRLLYTPNPELKAMQRRLLRKVFAKLEVHPAAMGFVRGKSVVDHARKHAGKALVLKVDIKDFFPSTSYSRIQNFFGKLGWQGGFLRGRASAQFLLMSLVYYKGLPQGAPTSPILSNAINYYMDCRLAALARNSRAEYSRYADDIVFSFQMDDVRFVRGVLRRIKKILFANGYRINYKKLRILRPHQQQKITGLVVNEKVQLPRKTRRLLRAVGHRLSNFKQATMTRQEYDGWRAFERMVKQKLRQRPNG